MPEVGATLDAPTLRRAMTLYAGALEAHREEIDSLNVFPVPDGDTGTNLQLTQRAVVEALEEMRDGSLAEVGEAIAHAALMGARGNSGVILSQILRGLCTRLGESVEADGAALAEALALAEEEARSAVARPVDGTILSVLHDAAVRAGDEAGDVGAVAEAAFRAAEASLERTPEQLPELREAGVVDAGGKGLVLMLDALRAAVAGGGLDTPVGPHGPVGHRATPAPTASSYGFETMFLLEAPSEKVGSLREALGRIGDSVVVVGGGGLYNVHVHTDDADAAVEAGRTIGEPREVRVASLDERVARHCLAGQARAARTDSVSVVGRSSLVAVVEGEGLEAIFRALGAGVVRGGPGNNPPVRDLLRAIERAPGEVVYVLPNHPNVWPAAEAAAREAGRRVEVVPTRSVPQGIAAALASSADDDSARSMIAAAGGIASARLARAEKAAETPGGSVVPGDWVGIDDADGEVWAVGHDPATVAAGLVADRLSADHQELVTVYRGLEGSAQGAEAVAAAIREARPGLETEIQRGDQPRYPYLIALE